MDEGLGFIEASGGFRMLWGFGGLGVLGLLGFSS